MVVKIIGQGGYSEEVNNIYYDVQDHSLTRNVDMDGNLNKGIDEEWL